MILFICSCTGFKADKYCKHICAVERYFPNSVFDMPSVDEVPDISSSVESPSSQIFLDTPAISIITPSTALNSVSPPSNSLSPQVVPLTERLATLLARVQNITRKEPNFDFGSLDAAVDAALVFTTKSTSGVLPARATIAPHIKTSTETARTMGKRIKKPNPTLPPLKTRKKPKNPNIDPSYGGGASSRSKAAKPKRQQYKAQPLSSPVSQYSSSRLPPARLSQQMSHSTAYLASQPYTSLAFAAQPVIPPSAPSMSYRAQNYPFPFIYPPP